MYTLNQIVRLSVSNILRTLKLYNDAAILPGNEVFVLNLRFLRYHHHSSECHFSVILVATKTEPEGKNKNNIKTNLMRQYKTPGCIY